MKMNDPWAGISGGDGKRVDANGKYDFFWMNFGDDEPGLALKLPDDLDEITPLPKLRNIDLSYRTMNSKMLVLRLRDNAQREVFEALCHNVVASAELADTLDAALARAIRRTRRWHFLLKGGRPEGLSVEEQRGLVGELAFLRQIVESLGSAPAIESWKGPTGSSKDFEFPSVCIEIKARRGAAKPHVSISSVHQLADVESAQLFLRVFDVDSAIKPDGMNLHDHVRKTSTLFIDDDTAYEAWEDLIDAAGYDENDEYESRRWVLGAERTYEVVSGFPRIPTPVPEGVDHVSYSISLDACAEFTFRGDLQNVVVGGMSDE